MLPELPRILKKREADWITTSLRKKILNHFDYSAVFEPKHTRGKNSFPFSEVKSHQRGDMLKIRHGKYLWKNPDMGDKTPPDLFLLVEEPAYVVIKYPKGVAIIPIDTFLLEEKRSKRKSLTWERARELSTIDFT